MEGITEKFTIKITDRGISNLYSDCVRVHSSQMTENKKRY
jgi:hypothetical protein